MAGFNLDTQKSFTLPGGGRGESGYIDISSGSRSQEVPTRLTSCYSGWAIAQTDTSNYQYNLIATTDCSISSAAITFYRHGPTKQEDTRYYYEVKGW
jgi:hypothetical protein